MFLITEGGRAPWRKRSMRMRGMVIQIQMASVWAEMGDGTEPRDPVGGRQRGGGEKGKRTKSKEKRCPFFPSPISPSLNTQLSAGGVRDDLKGGGLWGTRTNRSLEEVPGHDLVGGRGLA